VQKPEIKICHILNLITGTADGVYTHLRMLINLLPQDKFSQIIIFQGGDVIKKDLNLTGIKHYVLPLLGKKSVVFSAFQIYKILRSENIDIIQSHLVKPYIICGIVNFFLRKKHIFNYNGFFIQNVYYNKYEMLFFNTIHYLINKFKTVDLAVVPSFFSKSLLVKETNLFPEVRVYYNGYDPSFPTHTDNSIVKLLNSLQKDHFLVGIVARLEIQKRIDLSLKLLKELLKRGNNVYFVYFGDGPLEKNCRELASELNVNDNSIFLGFVENARNYIKFFNSLLFTSDWEGLPLTIWEAMANKVPIVATDVGGNAEIIQRENCGYIFPKGDIISGADYLEILIKDETSCKTLGENGYSALTRKYSHQQFQSFFENLYTELCPKKL